MSTPPPPPFPPSNQPPGQPFGSPGGTPFGAPPAGFAPVPPTAGGFTPGFAPGLTPGAAPPKPSRTPIFILVAVIVVLVVVGIVVLTGGKSSSTGGLDASAARTTVRRIINEADIGDSGTATLDSCPLGDATALDKLIAVKQKLDPGRRDANTVSQVIDSTDNYPAAILCGFDNDPDSDEVEVYYSAAVNPPADLEKADEADFGTHEKYTFDDPVNYKGGVITPSCVKAKDDQGLSGCSATWVKDSDRILFEVDLVGDVEDTDAVAALKAVLPTMVKNLGTSKATGVTDDSTDTRDSIGS
ncbi:MAG TPA: hypothetical protein VGM78_09365 [Ilumatobacteraceae bacterium]